MDQIQKALFIVGVFILIGVCMVAGLKQGEKDRNACPVGESLVDGRCR